MLSQFWGRIRDQNVLEKRRVFSISNNPNIANDL
jgi:hypothetical protein